MAAKISIERIGQIMKGVFTELKNSGGEAKLKDLFDRSEPKLNRTDYCRIGGLLLALPLPYRRVGNE